MLPLEKLGLRRRVLASEGCQLWATTRTIDRQRCGPAACTQLSLLNAGAVPLHIQSIEVSWLMAGTFCWYRPGWVEPGASWTLLDERSFDVLIALTRQKGRRGFGMQGVVHEVVVHLDQPEPLQLAFEVSWGFATPSYDMGFFLPALEAVEEVYQPTAQRISTSHEDVEKNGVSDSNCPQIVAEAEDAWVAYRVKVQHDVARGTLTLEEGAALQSERNKAAWLRQYLAQSQGLKL